MDNYTKTTPVNWWAEPKDSAHKKIYDAVSRLHLSQQERNDRNLRCLQLYGSMELPAMTFYAYAKAQMPTMPENRVKINVISSMVDTVWSKIGKMKPRPSFLTEKGNWRSQSNAKKLNQFIMGAFYKNDIWSMHQDMFRDGAILDVGAVKHYIDWDQKKICSERVLAFELYTDPADSLYGRPTHLYQVKTLHKEVAAELYPKRRNAIMNSSGTLGHVGATSQLVDDYVMIIESWRLPIGDKKGRHVISVENGTILDEEYKHAEFPFTFYRWSRPVVGFWGQSLADRLTGNQVEINKMLRIIQKSFHLGSAFKVFLEYGSKVAKEHINNEIGSIVYYTGQKPEFYVPKTVHEEFFRHLEWLIKNSYEEAGISQLSASAQKPSGLDSGRSIREYNDIETERFALTSQDYEASFLDTARHYIALAEEMREEGVELEVSGQSKQFIQSIKWSEIDIDKDTYVMQMFPVSMLPQRPEGKLAWVQELIQAGMVDADYGLELLDFPDTSAYTSLKNAWLHDTFELLDRMLYSGEFQPPEPMQNLERMLPIVQSAYLRAKNENAPDDRLELLRRWMTLAQAQMQSAQAAQQQAQGMQAPAEQAPSPQQAPQLQTSARPV